MKDKLLFQLTNFGQPIIDVVDGNFENRAELLLAHQHDGVDLQPDYAQETLKNLASVWKRPVNLITRVEQKGVMLRFDGTEHSEKKMESVGPRSTCAAASASRGKRPPADRCQIQ